MDHDPTPSAPRSHVVEHAAPSLENVQMPASHAESSNNSRDDNGTAAREPPPRALSMERQYFGTVSERYPTFPLSRSDPYTRAESTPFPPTARIRDRQTRQASSRRQPPTSRREWAIMRRTMLERLEPLVDSVYEEKVKYTQRASWTKYLMNIAIGLQVLLGAMTTAIAASLTDAKRAQISTAILGGLSTLVASYLAHARGSGEPELSMTRVKDLEQFERECTAFELDHGHEHGDYHVDERLDDMRRRFEELLGNQNRDKKLLSAADKPTQPLQHIP